MDQTFPLRRWEIVEEGPPVKTLKERWPALFTERQVFAEFNRIATTNLQNNFFDAMDHYTPRFVTIFKSKKGTVGETLAEFVQQIDLRDADRDEACAQASAGVLTVISEDVPLCPNHLHLDAVSTAIIVEGEKPDQTMSTKAEVIEELMEALLQDVIAHSAALEREKLKIMAAEAEAEVIQELMNIYLDETEERVEKHLAGDEMFEALTKAEDEADKEPMLLFINHMEAESLDTEAEAIKPEQIHGDETDTANEQLLGCEVMSAADTEAEASTDSVKTHMESNDTNNDHLLDVEDKSDAEPDWMFDYEPIKSWADFMEETEGTIDQSGEYNVQLALI
ncbi:hypothetical protein MHYP_G00364330 [Metynnis hypsauchen]